MKHSRQLSVVVVRHLDTVNVTTPLGTGRMKVGRIAVDETLDMVEFADGADGGVAGDLHTLRSGDDFR